MSDATEHENDSWVYDTAPDLDQSLLQRLENFPRRPDLLVYLIRSLAAIALRIWLKLYHRVRVVGREQLPDTSCVIVANHQSHLDAPSILSMIPLRRLHRAFPAAAKDYFFTSVPRIALSAIIVNALPFARDKHGGQSLRTCRRLLETEGNILILFPEGTRSTTGELGQFLPGIGMILGGLDVPVVPCRIDGAHAAWPKGAILPRPRQISLRLGTPMSFRDRERSKESAQAIASELRDAVERLG